MPGNFSKVAIGGEIKYIGSKNSFCRKNTRGFGEKAEIAKSLAVYVIKAKFKIYIG